MGCFRYPLFDAQIAGVDEATARRLLDDLVAEGSGPATRFTSPDPAWVIESESRYEPPAPDRTPFARVQFRNDAGTRIDLDLEPRVVGDDWWKFGVPTERGGTTLYVSDQRSSQTNWAASRSIGDLAAWVSIPAAVADEPTISVAAGIATGLHLVTESEWATTFRSAVATMASAPRQATMTIDGLRVTHHVAGWIDAVCATKGKDTSCHQNNQTGFGRAMDATNTPVYDPLEAGGTWAYAGYAPDVQGAPSYPLVGETLDGRRVGSSTPRSTDDLGGGKLFAFVAPDEADTLREADTNGPQATFGSNPVVRPIR